jgi:hypothetical protein
MRGYLYQVESISCLHGYSGSRLLLVASMLRFDLYHRSQRHTVTIESCGLPFKVSSAEVLPGGCIETLGLSNVLRQCSIHWQSISGGIVPSVNAMCDLSASTKRSKEMVCRSHAAIGSIDANAGYSGKLWRSGVCGEGDKDWKVEMSSRI